MQALQATSLSCLGCKVQYDDDESNSYVKEFFVQRGREGYMFYELLLLQKTFDIHNNLSNLPTMNNLEKGLVVDDLFLRKT